MIVDFLLFEHPCCCCCSDYVDRGKQSLETICLLLAYKVCVDTTTHSVVSPIWRTEHSKLLVLLCTCVPYTMNLCFQCLCSCVSLLHRCLSCLDSLCRSSTPRTSSFCEATTSALPSTESTASTMSVSWLQRASTLTLLAQCTRRKGALEPSCIVVAILCALLPLLPFLSLISPHSSVPLCLRLTCRDSCTHLFTSLTPHTHH